MSFSLGRSERKSGTRLSDPRRERPRIPVRGDRLEQRQGLGFRKGQAALPDGLAEVLAVDELAPALAGVDERPPDRIELAPVVLDRCVDRVAVTGHAHPPRLASHRPVLPGPY